jgi:hypothetical protein
LSRTPTSGTDIPLNIHSSGMRWIVRSGEPLVEPTHVEQPNHLSDHAVGFRLVAGPGQSLEHHGPDTSEREFAREHQPVGPCS